MELKGRETSVVPTQATLPASLSHKSLLDLAPTPSDGLDATLTALTVSLVDLCQR